MPLISPGLSGRLGRPICDLGSCSCEQFYYEGSSDTSETYIEPVGRTWQLASIKIFLIRGSLILFGHITNSNETPLACPPGTNGYIVDDVRGGSY